MVDTGFLFSNMKSPFHECYMTFWPFTSYSDFPTDHTFHQFYDLDTALDLHRITSGYNGAFATGVACQQGKLTLPSSFLGHAYAPIVETRFPDFAASFLDFSPWIPLGTFSILLDISLSICQSKFWHTFENMQGPGLTYCTYLSAIIF